MLELNKIYNQDCLIGMQDIPDKSIDCIITDLPYNVLAKNNPHAQWDKLIPFAPMWKQFERIIKDKGAILLFGQGMFAAKLMLSNPKFYRYDLIWDKIRKTGFLNAKRMPMRQHEQILVFYKSLPVYNPQMIRCEPHQRNHSRGNGTHKETNRIYGDFGKAEDIITDCKYPTSIISLPKGHTKEDWLHPTQKPVALIEYLIKTYTNEGETVLDACMGSGTTAIAAINTKRNFIGFELNSDFYELATKRIENRLSEPRLF